MPRQTKDQKIAVLFANLATTENKLLEALRERDEAIAAQAKPVGTADDYQRERLARHAFPQDAPSSVSWDDLAQYFGQRTSDDSEIHTLAENIAKQNDLDPALSLLELIEVFGESLTAARERATMIEKVGEALNLDETDAADILETLQDWGSSGTPNSVREDALTLLKDLGYDVRILQPAGYGASVPSFDDSQVVQTLLAQN